MDKLDRIRDWFVGIGMIGACALIINNLLFRLPTTLEKFTVQANAAARKASDAKTRVDELIKNQDANNENIDTALATISKSSKPNLGLSQKRLAEAEKQILRNKQLEMELYNWLDKQQDQINTIERAMEEKR